MKLTDNQEAWLKELESGNHAQCKERLITVEGEKASYCCLGVYAEHVLKLKREHCDDSMDHTTGFCFAFSNEDNDIYLGGYEALRLGLYDSTGKIKHVLDVKQKEKYFPALVNFDSSVFKSLANINDAGATFKEIARFIRDNPESVFNPNK